MKQFLLFFMLICNYMLCGAQATSITIDNQTPGWLSSKIGYGDQKTVKNLTVTGYVNLSDLYFIGDLMSKHNLSGHLNLTYAEVVDTEFSDSPTSIGGSLSMFNLDKKVVLDRFSIPKSLSTISPYLLARLQVDTLDYGSEHCYVLTKFLVNNRSYATNYCPKVLIVREGVTKIQLFGTDEGDEKNLQTVLLPHTIDSIGDNAFASCTNLSSVNLPDGIQSIGKGAFEETSLTPDTLYLPSSLKTYYSNSFPVSNGQVILLGNNVERFDNSSWHITKQTKLTFIINRVSPPIFIKGSHDSSYNPSYSDGKDLSSCTLYVPKEGYSMYSDPNYNSVGGTWSGWSNPYSHATIKQLPIFVSNIILTHSSETLNVGSFLNIMAEVLPVNADNKNILWTSSNSNIASVDFDGLVRAISSGKALIKATSQENPIIFATCEITVHQPLQAISLSHKDLSLKVGETFENMTVSYFPTSSDNKTVIWRSSDENIIKVNPNGKITAISAGEAKITVFSEENYDIQDECFVKVVQPATGLELNKTVLELAEEESEQLLATVTPNTATNKTVNWTSSDTSIALVSPNGTVYGIKQGQATIMATAVDGGFVALCKVTVRAKTILVDEIIINPTTFTGKIGETFYISASFRPENASNKTIDWSSSDNNVATVNNGYVQLIGKGTAVVAAKSCDGSEVEAICTINVANDSGIESIKIDKDSIVKIYTVTGYQIYEGRLKDAHLSSGFFIIKCNGKVIKARIGCESSL